VTEVKRQPSKGRPLGDVGGTALVGANLESQRSDVTEVVGLAGELQAGVARLRDNGKSSELLHMAAKALLKEFFQLGSAGIVLFLS
jgi:hypothetical protein